MMKRAELNDEEAAIFARRDALAASIAAGLLALGDEFTQQAARLAGKSPDDKGAGRAQMVIVTVVRALLAQPDASANATARGVADE